MRFQHGSDLIDVLGEVYETMFEDVVERLLNFQLLSCMV